MTCEGTAASAADRSATASASEPRRVREVLDRLHLIVDPCSAASVAPMSIVEMGLIRKVEADDGGSVDVYMRLSAPACLMVAYMAKEAARFVGELPWVTRVELHPDDGLEWDPGMIDPATQQRRRERITMLELSPRS
jgi:metal-sulfur cluster biosynthetic enzyme